MKQIPEQAYLAGCPKTQEGKVAAYIPKPEKADGSQLGVCVYTISGEHFCVGDTAVRFTIQSISKVISLAIALDENVFRSEMSNIS